MTIIDELRLMNETTILQLDKRGIDSKRNEIIKLMLNDEKCFSKMKKSEAFDVLEDIGISKDRLRNVYQKLIWYKEDTYDKRNIRRNNWYGKG